MGTSTKNAVVRKNKYRALEERVDFLLGKLQEESERNFSAIVRSEAMIFAILKKELVVPEEFNEGLKNIFDAIAENAEKQIDYATMSDDEIREFVDEQVTDQVTEQVTEQVTITVEDKKE